MRRENARFRSIPLNDEARGLARTGTPLAPWVTALPIEQSIPCYLNESDLPNDPFDKLLIGVLFSLNVSNIPRVHLPGRNWI